MSHIWPKPSLLIIHGGGNDIGKLTTLDLMFSMKQDLKKFQFSFNKCKVFFSEIIPRLQWLAVDSDKHLEKIRRRVNHMMEKFMISLGSFSYRYM